MRACKMGCPACAAGGMYLRGDVRVGDAADEAAEECVAKIGPAAWRGADCATRRCVAHRVGCPALGAAHYEYNLLREALHRRGGGGPRDAVLALGRAVPRAAVGLVAVVARLGGAQKEGVRGDSERLGELARACLRAVPVAHDELEAARLGLAEHREQLRRLRRARRAEEPRIAEDDL